MAAAAAVTLAAGCAPKAETPDIIPFPNSLEMHGGTFNAAGTTFYCTGIDDPLTLAAVEKFAIKSGDRLRRQRHQFLQ